VTQHSTDRQPLSGRSAARGERRRRGQPIDGLLLLDKPRGLSSNHAMLAVRRLLGAAKAGHGGTLDPMASGLLPIMLGEATKFSSYALDADKTYLASLMLGQTSTTGDAEGEIRDTAVAAPGLTEIEAALRAFVGPIEQIPPMHSAIKHEGRPLYQLARSGATVDRPARCVTIHSLELVDCVGSRLVMRVACSKGTYIRVLAEDIGRVLGCGAWLADLRREAAGGMALGADAITLDALESLEPLQRLRHVLPVECLLGSYERIDLDAIHTRRFLDGQRLRVGPSLMLPQVSPDPVSADVKVRVYGQRSASPSPPTLLGLAQLVDGVIAPIRLISTQDQEASHD
jgi:tRNA pseudouridine55 synthase